MRRIIAAGLAAAIGIAAGAGATPAKAAMCASPPIVGYVEFAPGSAEADLEAVSRHFHQVLIASRGRPHTGSTQVVAMGDIGEGAEWEAASEAQRRADKALAEARAAAVREAVDLHPAFVWGESVTVTVRDNRQLFTEEERTAEPGLTDRLRAVIRTWVRIGDGRDANGVYVTC